MWRCGSRSSAGSPGSSRNNNNNRQQRKTKDEKVVDWLLVVCSSYVNNFICFVYPQIRHEKGRGEVSRGEGRGRVEGRQECMSEESMLCDYRGVVSVVVTIITCV